MKLSDLGLPFKESGIEWRIGQAGKNVGGTVWATCLAYVSARAIMHRLDEVCGPDGWRTEYVIHPTGVICKLSIKCGSEWVCKEDGAEQTDIEAFKGGISSALKRAGSVWGIGRYLYDLESGFATIVPKGTPGAKFGKLPDGTVFYWNPPKIPDWALPAEKTQNIPPVSEPRKINSPVIGLSRVQLGSAIMRVAEEIRLGEQEMFQWITERYKKPMKDLTIAEMEDFRGVLETEKLQGVQS